MYIVLSGYLRILGAPSVQSCCTLSISASYHVFVYGRYCNPDLFVCVCRTCICLDITSRLPPARGGTVQKKIFHLANWSQLIHPGPASSMTKGFFGVESVMHVNAASLHIRAANTSTPGTLNDLTTDLIMAPISGAGGFDTICTAVGIRRDRSTTCWLCRLDPRDVLWSIPSIAINNIVISVFWSIFSPFVCADVFSWYHNLVLAVYASWDQIFGGNLVRSSCQVSMLVQVPVVVYPLPWPLLVGGVRCSRLWATSQLLRPSGQQCSHSGGVCPQIQGRQCGAYVGAVEEMMCVVCVDVTEGA